MIKTKERQKKDKRKTEVMAASSTTSKSFIFKWLTDSRHNQVTLTGVNVLGIKHLEIETDLLTLQVPGKRDFFGQENLKVLAKVFENTRLKTIDIDLNFSQREQVKDLAEALVGYDLTKLGFNIRDIHDSFTLDKILNEFESLDQLNYLEFRSLSNQFWNATVLGECSTLKVVKIHLDPDTVLADSILTELFNLKSLQLVIVEPVVPCVVDYSITLMEKISKQRPDLMIKYCFHFSPSFTEEVKQVSGFMLSLKSLDTTLVLQHIVDCKKSGDTISDIKYRNITFSQGKSCPEDLEHYLAREERFYYE